MANPHVPAWLRRAVFYQIYPQSFYDANGDGIGDLPGITAKLDYLCSLGVSALWINPCFASPFQDAGYDVTDYLTVAPRYGTNADLVALCAAARARGMRVCLDLVPGHTSLQHPWFVQSCDPHPNAMSNRYIWTGSCWEGGQNAVLGYCDRDANYLANFFHFQPALNYGYATLDPTKSWQLPVDHPDCLATRKAMVQVMRHWLEIGVDGFRVDMAGVLVKNDPDSGENIKLWRQVRAMLDQEYPEAVLISEWGFPSRALRAGFHIDFMLHFGAPAYTALLRGDMPEYNKTPFFSRAGGGNIHDFLDSYLAHYLATRRFGYISLPTGNHDIARLRRGRDPRDMAVAFAMLLTMPGIPFIYYGDEIGMRHITGLVSKEGGYNRTGARTPMQWNNERNAGFSAAPAEQMYLPIDSFPGRPTVVDQEVDEGSLLNQVRRLIALRRATPALGADGNFVPLYAKAKKYPFVYLRQHGKQRVIVAVNPTERPAVSSFSWDGSRPSRLLVGADCDLTFSRGKGKISMRGVSYGVFGV